MVSWPLWPQSAYLNIPKLASYAQGNAWHQWQATSNAWCHNLKDHHHTPQPEAKDKHRNLCTTESQRCWHQIMGWSSSINSKGRSVLGLTNTSLIQATSNYRSTPPTCDCEGSLPVHLNHYAHAWFPCLVNPGKPAGPVNTLVVCSENVQSSWQGLVSGNNKVLNRDQHHRGLFVRIN